MNERKVSDAVIRRLPRYYRYLNMLDKLGEERISSQGLAERMGLNPSQVRQDFNCFGGFGQQGYGYNVKGLLSEIKNILGLDEDHSVIIVGAGNIGKALANFEGFVSEGFQVKALFDIDKNVIGQTVNGFSVLPMEELESFVKENSIKIGVIAARRSAAQEIAEKMSNAGIKGIWNFAPIDLICDIPSENVHLNDSIMQLTYRMKHDC